jgi:hypothetical protein
VSPDREEPSVGPDQGGAGRVLAAVTGLLPPERRAWGAAMRAELAAVEPGRARWGSCSAASGSWRSSRC